MKTYGVWRDTEDAADLAVREAVLDAQHEHCASARRERWRDLIEFPQEGVLPIHERVHVGVILRRYSRILAERLLVMAVRYTCMGDFVQCALRTVVYR